MKLFSRGGECAIRAMLQVAQTQSFAGFSPKKICADAEISEPFGHKAFAEMVKAHIIQGMRGPGGGYSLLRHPAEISLLDVVLAVDGPNAFAECPMGASCQAQGGSGGAFSCEGCTLPNPMCELRRICPLHDLWRETRKLVISELKLLTLQVLQDHLKKNARESNL